MITAPVIAHPRRAGFNPPAPFVTPASPAPQGEDGNPLHPEERAEGPRHEGQSEEDGAPAPSVTTDAKDVP